MSQAVPLLAPAEGSPIDLDALLEVAARTGARVGFELLEGGDPGSVAGAVRERGAALSTAQVESPALLEALGARARWHAGGELPALFTDPYPLRAFERGAPGTLQLIEAAGGVLAPLPPADSGLGLTVVSTARAAAIVDAAFAHARSTGRGRICVVHATPAAASTDGLFLHAARNVAVRHGDVAYEDLTFEAFARRAVRDRGSFEVLVGPAPVADAALALLAAVADLPRPAGVVLGAGDLRLFGRHGAGEGQAALFRSLAALLWHVGEERAAERLERALTEASLQGDFPRRTAELVSTALSR